MTVAPVRSLRVLLAAVLLAALAAACGGGGGARPADDAAPEADARDAVGPLDAEPPADVPPAPDVPADVPRRPDTPDAEPGADVSTDAASPGDVPADAAPDVPGAEDAAAPDARTDAPMDGTTRDVPEDTAAGPDGVDAGEDVPSYPQDPALVALDGPCGLAERFGGFKVELNEDVGYTAVDGVVRNGVVPGLVPEEAYVEGDCRLLRRLRLVCDPPCEPGTTCSADASCVPMPTGQDMGTVVIRGLVQRVTLTPLQPGNIYFYTRLPHPGFAPDRVVQLTNTTGYVAPLELYGVGVAPLVPGEDRWVLTSGQPLALTWAAPGEGARSRVFVELNIDQHGVTPLTMTCDLPDTGAATIPASVVDGLIGAGVTGFPTGRVTRRTVDSQRADGGACVELVVSSVRQIGVEVTGHVPCARDSDCPPPLTCNLLIQQCE